jgi:NAD(P)-dependent dehydrogenase (short-subunit alcohol dehydrogenase family)
MESTMNALITGGTSGIGSGVARQLARRGWNVTLVGRNRERGTRIAAETGGTFLQADLSLMTEVHRIARQVETSFDALVLCAGVVSIRSSLSFTGEGVESTFATNYLSKFALSQLFLPKILADGCIVMVGGNGKYANASTAWETPQAGFKAAFKAALAVDLYASHLSSQLSNLRVHTCYPGMVRTNLFRETPLPIRLVTKLFGTPIEQGSAHLARLVLEHHPETHWNQATPRQFSPALPAGSAVETLWDYSQQIVASYRPAS